MAQVDNWRKYKSLFSTTLSTGIGTGTSDTITPASVSGLPTDTEVTLTIDRVDANGVATPLKLERITGTISGGNLINYTRGIDGTTEQAHSAGATVEMVWNSDDWNDAVSSFLTQHKQDGTHAGITTSSISASQISLTSGATITAILDEDTMSSNSATAVPTQQSVKAYVDPTVTTDTSDTTPTPTGDKKYNEYYMTALAGAAELQAPSGTPANGNKLIVRIKDDGTARALTYNAIYRAVGVTLPTTTVISKTVYMGFIYNSTDSKWDCLAVGQEA